MSSIAHGLERSDTYPPIKNCLRNSAARMQHPDPNSRDGAIDERIGDEDAPINASGHVQELDRNFSLLSITAVGIVTGNTWAALGGSIVSRTVSTTGPRSDNQTRLSLFTTEVRRESSMNCKNASNVSNVLS